MTGGMAIILENQQLYSKIYEGDPAFKENMVINTRQLLKKLTVFELISLQPILAPTSTIYFSRLKYANNKAEWIKESQVVTAKTRIIKIEPVETDITNEILTDIRNNVNTIAHRKCPINLENIQICLAEMSGAIHRKTMRGNANWIVVHPDVAILLGFNVDNLQAFQQAGTLFSAYKVYSYRGMPKNEILCGRIEDLIDGYIYCPYILLSQEKDKLLLRYAKLLKNPKHYGLIKYGT